MTRHDPLSGVLDRSNEKAPPHHCDLPAIRDFGSRNGMPYTIRLVNEGARFYCDCGRVWVCVMSPARRRRYGYSPRSLTWTAENRGQRRQRLGLRWWQRG